MDALADDYTTDFEAPTEAVEAEQVSQADRLMTLMAIPNIAAVLDQQKLDEIASRVIDEYKIDDGSRDGWKQTYKEALDLAMMTVDGEKDYPFRGAANVKYPLLATASLQFSARAYPAIVPGDRIVKSKVNGRDETGEKAKRAERVSEYTSWQLTDDMPEWEPDTDRLLVILPIAGCAFRKRYFDPALGRQCSRLVTADRLVVNYRARSLEDSPRVTEEMSLYPYEIQERIRDGRFIEFDYSNLQPQPDVQDATDASDKDTPHLFLEQHRLLDLDGDGYAEPYIVTVHLGAQKTCRIVANYTMDTVRMTPDGRVAAIRKRDYYVKYGFLPSPDGGFYELGFGWLLKSTNEAINTNLNEMLDAGHLANIQGGFVSAALGLREKQIRLKQGEWKVLNTQAPLNSAIMPVTYPGPSDTLFKLLGLLVEMGKEVAAIKDVLSGEVKQNMQPTTVLALIEQGMQFFTAIYKRIHRSLKAELVIHNQINKEHLDAETYNAFFDAEQQFDPKADFNDADMDVSPVSDPTRSSKMQKLAQAEFLKAWATENPTANVGEVNKRILEAAQIEDPEKLIQPPNEEQAKLKARGALAEVMVKENTAEKLAAETDALEAKASEPPKQEAAPPQPTAAELEMERLEVATKAQQLEKARLEVIETRARIAEKDVEVGEDGEAQSRSAKALQTIMDTQVALATALTQGFSALADLIVKQGDEARLAAERQVQIMMAPNVLDRDENGRAIGSRKALN